MPDIYQRLRAFLGLTVISNKHLGVKLIWRQSFVARYIWHCNWLVSHDSVCNTINRCQWRNILSKIKAYFWTTRHIIEITLLPAHVFRNIRCNNDTVAVNVCFLNHAPQLYPRNQVVFRFLPIAALLAGSKTALSVQILLLVIYSYYKYISNNIACFDNYSNSRRMRIPRPK